MLESLFNEPLFKKIPTQVFSCEICIIFKNSFFYEHLRTTASKPIKTHFISFINKLIKSEMAANNMSNIHVFADIPMYLVIFFVLVYVEEQDY